MSATHWYTCIYNSMSTCHPYRPAGGESPFGSCVITGCSVTLLASCCTDATLTGGCTRTAGELGADLEAGKISAFKCGRNFSIRCHDNTHSWYCGVYWMLDTSPLVSMAMVSITSPKRPAVDITSNMFLSDSGMASDCKLTNEVKHLMSECYECIHCSLISSRHYRDH